MTAQPIHTYRTLREAHNALKLDAGFDPFLHGGVRAAGRIWRRPTKRALAAIGYAVQPPKPRQPRQPA